MASDFVMVLRYVKKSYKSFLKDVIPFVPDKLPNFSAPIPLEASTEPKAPNSRTESKGPNPGTKLKRLSSKIKLAGLNSTSEREKEPEKKVRRSFFRRSLMPGRHFMSALHSIKEREHPICNEKVLTCKKELEGFFSEVGLHSDEVPKRHLLSTQDSKPKPIAPLCESESLSSESEPESLSSESDPGELKSESEALDSESEPEKYNSKPRNQPKALNSGSSSKAKSVQKIVNPESKALRHKYKTKALKSKSDPKKLRSILKPETLKSGSDLEEVRPQNKLKALKSESESPALSSESKPDTLGSEPEPKAPKPKDEPETLYFESDSEAENFKAARLALNTRFEVEIREIIARERIAMRRRARKKRFKIPQRMTPIRFRPEDGQLHYDAVLESVKARRPIGLVSKADRKEFRRQLRCLPQDSDSSSDNDNLIGKRVVELYNLQEPNCVYTPTYPTNQRGYKF